MPGGRGGVVGYVRKTCVCVCVCSCVRVCVAYPTSRADFFLKVQQEMTPTRSFFCAEFGSRGLKILDLDRNFSNRCAVAILDNKQEIV